MKRICLLSTAFVATLSTASVASAETKPAVIWVPTGDVDVTPSSQGACANVSMSADVAAAGCVSGIEEGTRSAHPMADAISTGVETAFAAYNVRVVNEAPPVYVPTYLVLSSEDRNEESMSYTCAGAGLTCAARGRDSVGFTNAGTMNCTNPDLLQSVLYTIGRMAGLEGKEDAMDAMHYPPDMENPVAEFIDACGPISNFLGGEDGMTPLPVECTSIDHAGDCESEQQNSHADLLDYFGEFTEDTTPPTATLNMPAEGDVIAEGSALSVDVSFEDDSNYVAARILIESDELAGLTDTFPLGNISFCTTDVCDVNFLDGDPFKTADTAWSTGDLPGLPGGAYVITVEAQDYAGNAIEAIKVNVTIEGGPVDPTEGEDTDSDGSGGSDTMPTTDTMPTSDSNDTFASESNGDSSDGDSDTDGDETAGGDGGGSSGGCMVGPEQGAGGSFVLLMGLLGLGFARRRE